MSLKINQNLPQKWPPPNDNFHILQTQVHKNVLLQPPFFQYFFNLSFLKAKNIDVEQKHKLESGKTKTKKGFERENKTGNKQRIEKTLKFSSFMLFFS